MNNWRFISKKLCTIIDVTINVRDVNINGQKCIHFKAVNKAFLPLLFITLILQIMI